ncbi:MAG: HesA/MoeB/ThiF family protein [Desulfitobacteriaceae bacterium]
MDDLRPYLRQIQLTGFGEEAQHKLLVSTVAVIGAGGLGSPLLLYLTAAGIGTLHIFDPDHVDITNLNRQILYTPTRIGTPKAESIVQSLKPLNPNLHIHAYPHSAQESGFDFSQVDVIADATDNFTARYYLNTVALKTSKPWVHASIYGAEGRVTSFIPGETPCYHCLNPMSHRGKIATDGHPVLGVAAGIGGILQASEIINFLAFDRFALAGKLLTYDLYNMTFDTLNIPYLDECPACKGPQKHS